MPNSTIYTVKTDENETYGPYTSGTIWHTCVKRQNWVIYWTSLGTCCDNYYCPILKGKVKLSLWCNGVTVTDLSKRESLHDKSQVVVFRQGVAQVQGTMMTSTSAPVHQRHDTRTKTSHTQVSHVCKDITHTDKDIPVCSQKDRSPWFTCESELVVSEVFNITSGWTRLVTFLLTCSR